MNPEHAITPDRLVVPDDKGRTLTDVEVREADAAILAEKFALILTLLHADARENETTAIRYAYDRAGQSDFESAMEVAWSASALRDKFDVMTADVQPLLTGMLARHELARKERMNAANH